MVIMTIGFLRLPISNRVFRSAVLPDILVGSNIHASERFVAAKRGVTRYMNRRLGFELNAEFARHGDYFVVFGLVGAAAALRAFASLILASRCARSQFQPAEVLGLTESLDYGRLLIWRHLDAEVSPQPGENNPKEKYC